MSVLTVLLLASAAICFAGWLYLRPRTSMLRTDEPPEIETNFEWDNHKRAPNLSDRYGWDFPDEEHRDGIEANAGSERWKADPRRPRQAPFADAEESDSLEVPAFLRRARADARQQEDSPPSPVVLHRLPTEPEVRQRPIQAEEPVLAPVPNVAPAAKAVAPPKSAPVPASAPKASSKSTPLVADHPLGRVYFDPPSRMTEGEVTDMHVLIVSPSHISTVDFADVTSSKRSPQTAEVAAPGLMFARVYADPVALQVITLGNDLVKVDSALGYGQWQWRLRALQPGNHKITLRISHARAISGGGGLYAEDIIALNRDIMISVSKSRVARTWLLSAAGALVGAAASQMVEGAIPVVRNQAYGLVGWELPTDTTSNPVSPSPSSMQATGSP
ncbi:MAG: hypothetical protein KF874_06235 [Rhizobiaceae bacterium]|nr:hypothetical protein [Rhizobiaceae bacterium]